MDIEEHKRQIGAAVDELNRYLDGVETVERLRVENAQIRAWRESVIAETELGADGARYVRSAGGLRRLPDSFSTLLNVEL